MVCSPMDERREYWAEALSRGKKASPRAVELGRRLRDLLLVPAEVGAGGDGARGHVLRPQSAGAADQPLQPPFSPAPR